MSILEPDANDPEHTFYVNGLTLSCICGFIKDVDAEKYIDGIARRHLIIKGIIEPPDTDWVGPIEERDGPSNRNFDDEYDYDENEEDGG